MTDSTRALVQAMADAVRREASAREAAAAATTEAREAVQLQVALLDELRASGIKLTAAMRHLSWALDEPIDMKKWQRLAARYRTRSYRRRSAGAPKVGQ